MTHTPTTASDLARAYGQPGGMAMIALRAAPYCRLSQDRSGLSENVQIQDREARAYAEDMGWNVTTSFHENDTSASKFSRKPRPQYNLLIAAIRRSEVDVIVCTEMTRLYRRIEELLPLIKLAETTSLKGIWTTDGIGYDLSTPEGCHAAIGAVNNAQLESAKISKRQKRKKKVRAQEGKFAGGGRPYGYEDDGVTVRENEALVIQDCVRRLIAGETQQGIVRDLNQRGVPTGKGNLWTVGNFKRTLVKKRYIGIREHLGEEYPAVWPAIIDPADHALMLARLNEAAQPWGHGLIKGRQYLLSGMLFCGACGGAMFGSGRQCVNGYQRRYRCKPYDNHGNRIGCGKVFRGADPLDLFVSEAVLFRYDSPTVLQALTPGEDLKRAEELASQLTGHKLRAKQLAREYSLGEHSKEDYQTMRDTVHGAMAEVQEKLASLQSSRTAELLPRHDLIREVWAEANLEWRRTVTQLIVRKILVHPQGSGVKLWNGFRFQPETVEVVWSH